MHALTDRSRHNRVGVRRAVDAESAGVDIQGGHTAVVAGGVGAARITVDGHGAEVLVVTL